MPRRLSIAVAVALVLAVAFVLAYRVALDRLRGGVERALGPLASVGSLSAGFAGIELTDVRIRADRKARPAWPADDELRAARIVIVPDLSRLWAAGWHVSSVTVDDGFVSLLRARDGKLRVLPSLLDKPAAGDSAIALRIGEIRLRRAAVELYDATVRQPPHRIRIERIDARVGPLALPGLAEPIGLHAEGVFKGPQRDGRLALDGRIAPAKRDATLAARFAGVDLVALQPYLLRVGEGGVKRGTLDLALQARVDNNRLHAPGSVTLTGIEFGSGSGALSTFAGVPRQAVLATISRDGRVQFDFSLDGRLDDPKFSLNESFAVKVAAGIAETLGVSVGGVVAGVGNVIKGLLGR